MRDKGEGAVSTVDLEAQFMQCQNERVKSGPGQDQGDKAKAWQRDDHVALQS